MKNHYSMQRTVPDQRLRLLSYHPLYYLLSFAFVFWLPLTGAAQSDGLPRGATDMPYHRYESEAGTYGGSAVLYSNPEFLQEEIAAEASDQQYVGLPANGSFVQWPIQHVADGITLRFTMPDGPGGEGEEGALDFYVNDVKVRTVELTSYWAWQYFPSERPVNEPGPKPRMRFDEVHFKLASALQPGDVLKVQKTNGDAFEYGVDFVEIERVPPPVQKPAGYVNITDFGATPNDGIDDLPAFQDALVAAGTAGTGVYLPEGVFTLDNKLLLETDNIGVVGAGMWYTELFFSREERFSGGILARCTDVDVSGFYMNTINDQRFLNGDYVIYKSFMGTYGNNSKIHDVWMTHFEVGAWIAGYDAPYPIDVTQNLQFYRNRVRNNYADGINLCQGTSNSTVYQNNFRSNGDDAMAVWPDNSFSAPVAVNNVFRYNTVENNYRAGGAAIFGGDGHEVHHCIIKDGMSTSGLRVTSDFPGYHFENTTAIRFYENTIIACGTSEDLFRKERGAIEVNATNYPINNVFFENIDIIDAQRHGVQIGSTNTANLSFENISINGTGLDPVTASEYTGPLEGAAIMVHGRSGTATFNNLTLENIERDPPTYVVPGGYNLVIGDSNTPLTGISLSEEEVSLTSGATAPLRVNFSPSNASNKRVSWTTSDEDVAIYDEAEQRVRAVGVGTATLTVTSEEGDFTASVTVSVEAAVSVVATTDATSEGGAPGVFTVSIAEVAQAITVQYAVSGTASAADYSAEPELSGTIQLTPSAPSREITVTPVDDDAFEGSETLVLTLQAGSGYQVGGDSTATIRITDNENPPCEGPSVAFTETAPAIDQTVDEAWSVAPVSAISNATIGAPAGDYRGQWRAMFTATALYVLVEVDDATLTNDSGAEWWNDDAIELFIDGDNSQGSSYDGVNDFQLGFRWDDATLRVGGNSVKNVAGVNYELYATGSGYALEVVIPWTTIGTSPTLGDRIGFDVSVDDDDNGGVRDAQVAAIATSSQGWDNPSLFGSLFLTTCEGGPDTPSPAVTGVSVSPASASLAVGETQALTATVTPQAASNRSVTWSSDDADVASVDNTGRVTAVAPGSAQVTATTTDGGLTASSTITVTNDTGGDGDGNNVGTAYRIKNVWQNGYITDGGAQVTYVESAPGEEGQWVVEEVANGYVEIRNVGTGDYIHVEELTGTAQSTTRSSGWWSSQWEVSDAGNGASRIRNRWQANAYLHVEGLLGKVQYGPIADEWASAQWVLEPVNASAARNANPSGLRTGSTMEAYPNPVESGYLDVEIKDAGTSAREISLYTLSGELVTETTARSVRTRLDLRGVPAGVYLLKVGSGTTPETRKIIVQ